MKSFALALLVTVFFGCLPVVALTPAEAAHHIGEAATVTGDVAEVVKYKTGVVILYFGHAHPKQSFTAYFAADSVTAIGFDKLKDCRGKTLTIDGTIREDRGKPQIRVSNISQIRSVK